MNLPALPTDNLYKFCAISGLVALLFGVTFPAQKIFEARKNIISVSTKINVLKQTSEYLREDVDELQRHSAAVSQELDAIEKQKRPDGKELDSVQSQSNATGKELDAVRKKSREIGITKIKLQGEVQTLALNVHNLWAYCFLSFFCSLGGLLVTCYGFICASF